MKHLAWIFALIASTASAGPIPLVYDFHLDSFTLNGTTYAADDFSVELSSRVGVNNDYLAMTPTSYDGDAITDVDAGAFYLWKGKREYVLDINPVNDGRGVAGGITGFFTPYINVANAYGPVTIPNDINLGLAPGNLFGSMFAVQVADGCENNHCGTGYDIAYTTGTIATHPVPTPTTWGLMAIGLALMLYKLPRPQRQPYQVA